MITPAEISSATDLTILVSILVDVSSALLAFEGVKLLGLNLYGGQTFRIHWKWLLVVGILASIINSVGLAIAFSRDDNPSRCLLSRSPGCDTDR